MLLLLMLLLLMLLPSDPVGFAEGSCIRLNAVGRPLDSGGGRRARGGVFGDFGERPLASESQLHLHCCCSGVVLLSLECQASVG
jgi:hypothetical protein